jgi:hypothetical protein
MLSSTEMWASVIALLLPGLIYLIRDAVDEFAREDASDKPWQLGDRPRRQTQTRVWASHEVLVVAVCLTDLLVIQALIK